MTDAVATARQLLDAARLEDAIAVLIDAVKRQPADTTIRMFLFELFCFQGDLVRAGKQLDAVQPQLTETSTQLAAQGYRALLEAEQARRAVFAARTPPNVPVGAGPMTEAYSALLAGLASGAADVAARLDAAEALLPELTVTRNGAGVEGFRDADDRVAGVLEAMVGAEYFWIPYQQITRLQVLTPTRLRELAWLRAEVDVVGQATLQLFVPALYVNSHIGEDALRLGRDTNFDAVAGAVVVGVGARTALVGEESLAFSDLGELTFSAVTART